MRIRLYAPALVALLALAAGAVRGAGAAPAPAPHANRAPAACPNLLLLESTTGRYYVAVFAAPARLTASFALTLYSKTAAYEAQLSNVAIVKAAPGSPGRFRSSAQAIKNVDSGELLGASVAPALAGCGRQDLIIPSVASLTAPDRTVDPAVDALEQQVSAETPSAPVITPVPATGVQIPACEDPFDDATPDAIVRPALTKAQRANPDLEQMTIQAEIGEDGRVIDATVSSSSANGDVDALALAAARKSTFHPARFACRAIPSTRLIRTEFTR